MRFKSTHLRPSSNEKPFEESLSLYRYCKAHFNQKVTVLAVQHVSQDRLSQASLIYVLTP